MSGSSDALATVTLRVNRFTPRPERDRPARSGSPFAKKSSPFGGASASARRRPRGKQWVQEYTLPVRREDTVLDCLLKIKRTVDPTWHSVIRAGMACAVPTRWRSTARRHSCAPRPSATGRTGDADSPRR